jgi:hypothetical protein
VFPADILGAAWYSFLTDWISCAFMACFV